MIFGWQTADCHSILCYKQSLCLEDMIDSAMTNVEENTTVIDFLSRGGTSLMFSEAVGVCVQTARKRLNISPYASAIKRSRPYQWSLKK